jgi:hypothetical protein
MAYGGGGYLISRALAEMLRSYMEQCLPRYDALYGQDSRMYGCISELDVPLTVERGFHQLVSSFLTLAVSHSTATVSRRSNLTS